MTETARRFISAFDDRRAADTISELLRRAEITVGGDKPWDIKVHDERLFARVLRDGTLGVGESYMDGWWDCQAIDQMFERIIRVKIDSILRESWVLWVNAIRSRILNLQTLRAFEVGERHYDVGNDLYQEMLGQRMMYTCAYWKNVATLDQAQEAKLDLICRKIGARSGMRILDLGCGWGGFAEFAAKEYGCQVVGYTVSREQYIWAKDHNSGLPVDIRLEDYRKASGTYDAVVSIGLMEHVGPKNYRAYMQLASDCLAPDGIMFVHTIAGRKPRLQIDPWYHKYIFPNAVIPTLGQLATAMDDLFVPEDVQNIGEHYDRTLMAWWQNFEKGWPRLQAKYGDVFYRMWKFYLMTSAAEFRTRALSLIQIVATANGTPQPAYVRAV